ncbi:hypothetical protein LTR56_018007 [Elasticomyces elasticus]|nr:hypothetical protein LTR56_018007 [Elasticomyces elasticus]KAK3663342.1 hypothetical protein LTR22_005749 [Elasticomyces elasticus]KAK4925421.1 hypothetical protein LTR49_007485 [Elasticomyces elasticus]KAK5764516.1 hypothetical protein LTS12_005246 [Elasticomyces elasticus]
MATALQTRSHSDAPTNSSVSSGTCHLLALPPELRLLIYEAYFGERKVVEVYWDETKNDCWYHRVRGNNSLHHLALLQACQKMYHEAQPMLHERRVPLLKDPWFKRRHEFKEGKESHTLETNQLRFLKQVPAVIIDVMLMELEGWEVWPNILEAIDQGANVKSLTFVLLLYMNHGVFSEDGLLTKMISKLRCPSSVVIVHAQVLSTESSREWTSKSGFAIRESISSQPSV